MKRLLVVDFDILSGIILRNSMFLLAFCIMPRAAFSNSSSTPKFSLAEVSM